MGSLTASRSILGCAAALALALLGLTVWSVFEAQRTVIRQAEVTSQNLARTLEQHTVQALQSADLRLRGLAERLGSEDGAEVARFSDTIRRTAPGLTQIRALLVIDGAGQRVAGGAGVPGMVRDHSAADYFTAQRADPALGLYIGEPARNPADGEWTVPL